jgi:hypothetical protein
MIRRVNMRIVLGGALLGGIVTGALALAGGNDYRARSYVIRVPPAFSGEAGLARARDDAMLRRALKLAGEGERGVDWLRERSTAELTSRMDLSFRVETPDREQTAALATAYAKAYREEIPRGAGLTTRGQGARDAHRTLGPIGWTLLGAVGGLWLGMAVAIVREGRALASSPGLGSVDRARTA